MAKIAINKDNSDISNCDLDSVQPKQWAIWTAFVFPIFVLCVQLLNWVKFRVQYKVVVYISILHFSQHYQVTFLQIRFN